MGAHESPLRLKRVKRGLVPYTVLRCPMSRQQFSWCRGLCRPIRGRGLCGRLAPHLLRGRTQRAIARYNVARARAAAAAS